MQGKGSTPVQHAPWRKTIPANAGKSRGSGASRNPREDNPRKCREKIAGFPFSHFALRQSPQMQGKELIRRRDVLSNTTIPANAGKRQYQGKEGWHGADNPRKCREKSAIFKQLRRSEPRRILPQSALAYNPLPRLLFSPLPCFTFFFIFSSNTLSYSPCLTLTLSDWAMLLA